jgi:hypothetical protein
MRCAQHALRHAFSDAHQRVRRAPQHCRTQVATNTEDQQDGTISAARSTTEISNAARGQATMHVMCLSTIYYDPASQQAGRQAGRHKHRMHAVHARMRYCNRATASNPSAQLPQSGKLRGRRQAARPPKCRSLISQYHGESADRAGATHHLFKCRQCVHQLARALGGGRRQLPVGSQALGRAHPEHHACCL